MSLLWGKGFLSVLAMPAIFLLGSVGLASTDYWYGLSQLVGFLLVFGAFRLARSLLNPLDTDRLRFFIRYSLFGVISLVFVNLATTSGLLVPLFPRFFREPGFEMAFVLAVSLGAFAWLAVVDSKVLKPRAAAQIELVHPRVLTKPKELVVEPGHIWCESCGEHFRGVPDGRGLCPLCHDPISKGTPISDLAPSE